MINVQFSFTDNGKKALLKAYECYKQKRAWHKAGITLEQVVKIDIERGNFEDLPKETEKAAKIYEKAGQPDTAALLLEKVAKVFEEQEPEICHKMLKSAAEIVETENRPIQAAYFISKKLQLWIQKGEFCEAADSAKKLIRLYQVKYHFMTKILVLGLSLIFGKPSRAFCFQNRAKPS